MRAVTFSNKDTASQVNDLFLSAWVSRDPKFHNCDMEQEERILHQASDIYATGNFATFWVTPELDVLHYVSGYYSPAFFNREVRFAVRLAAELLDDDLKLKQDSRTRYRKLHAARAEISKTASEALNGKTDLGQVTSNPLLDEEIRKAIDQGLKFRKDERKAQKSDDQTQRSLNLSQGLKYLADVSLSLYIQADKTRAIVKLPDIIQKYKSGNPFGEGRPNWSSSSGHHEKED